jgi:hypothetical protein
MNLKPVLNKTSPQAHIELEFDVVGVPGKLVKYVVHMSKRKIEKKNCFSSNMLPKLSTSFWSQGIRGVKLEIKKSIRILLKHMILENSTLQNL